MATLMREVMVYAYFHDVVISRATTLKLEILLLQVSGLIGQQKLAIRHGNLVSFDL